MAYRNLNISIGLVNIPVALDKLFGDNSVKGNKICAKHNEQIKYNAWCPECNGTTEEVVIGYKNSNSEFVKLDLDSIKPESSKNVSLDYFTSLEEIDPLFYDTTYVLNPGKDSDGRGFVMLQQALKSNGMAAVGKANLSSREKVVVIRYSRHLDTLVLHTCNWEDEIRRDKVDMQHDKLASVLLSPAEEKLANDLVTDVLYGSFNPSAYQDEYTIAMTALLSTANGNGGSSKPNKKKEEPAADLSAMLKASVEAAKKAKK